MFQKRVSPKYVKRLLDERVITPDQIFLGTDEQGVMIYTPPEKKKKFWSFGKKEEKPSNTEGSGTPK